MRVQRLLDAQDREDRSPRRPRNLLAHPKVLRERAARLARARAEDDPRLAVVCEHRRLHVLQALDGLGAVGSFGFELSEALDADQLLEDVAPALEFKLVDHPRHRLEEGRAHGEGDELVQHAFHGEARRLVRRAVLHRPDAVQPEHVHLRAIRPESLAGIE